MVFYPAAQMNAPQQGFLTELSRAVQDAHDFVLVSELPCLTKDAEAFRNSSSFLYLSCLSEQELQEWLLAADYLLWPSDALNFPETVVYDALAAGVLVIAGEGDYAHEILTPEVAVFVAQPTSETLHVSSAERFLTAVQLASLSPPFAAAGSLRAFARSLSFPREQMVPLEVCTRRKGRKNADVVNK